MRDTITIRIYVEMSRAGSGQYEDIEVDRAEWEAMTEEEQSEYMREPMDVALSNYVSVSYSPVDE